MTTENMELNSKLMKELDKSRKIYPLRAGKNSTILKTYLTDRQNVLQLIGRLFNENIEKSNKGKTKHPKTMIKIYKTSKKTKKVKGV